ncbi:esterase YqiA [Psychrosphaera ytuae]|uniref:Esterase YqiA n=1 Tax=Psychrosphaera ytuae TaxID=2820710 RepID=A0A975HL43_9GAMM|nr:YqiA/YcfP family alpha/beta fold hydrolase [Psychrosphaera ytuae]QTH64964.1 esterase YqiA [Psychrosphaera ytuae]
MPSILYLHGFHSSPMSEKAQLFSQYIKQHYPQVSVIAPQLAVTPDIAINQVEALVEQHYPELIGVVGSSLGGYLSTYLHNKYGLKAVVINPAVKPFELLSDYLGPQIHPITDQSYTLTPSHMCDLQRIYQPFLKQPEKVWCLQQEGDEVLDYRMAVEHYKESKLTLEKGGDHSFIGFSNHLPQIVEFLL